MGACASETAPGAKKVQGLAFWAETKRERVVLGWGVERDRLQHLGREVRKRLRRVDRRLGPVGRDAVQDGALETVATAPLPLERWPSITAPEAMQSGFAFNSNIEK